MATQSVSSQKTIQQIIDETSKSTNDRNTGELGKDDFLNLLVTQLRYQDPLNPVDDKEFIGQMAQFSSLEQMQNLNTSFSSIKAFSLIGKRVTGTIKDEKTNENKVVEGIVTNVKVENGKSYVVVKDTDIPIESVTGVSEGLGSANNNLSMYTSLIGSRVDGYVYNSENGEIVGVNGVVKSIQKGLYEDYAVIDGARVEISDIVTETPSTDPNFKSNYLRDNKGMKVNVEIIDRSTGHKVPVTATLSDYSIDGSGKITALLDNLNIPVESVTNISGTQQKNMSSYSTLVGHKVKGSVNDLLTGSQAEVEGIVQSIESGLYGEYAVVNGAELEIQSINSETALADQAANEKYLTDHIGEQISVIVRGTGGNNKVTVNAVLSSFTIDDNGVIKAVFNKVNVPVDSVTGIEAA